MKKYTFKDWLKGELFKVKNENGELLTNDSEDYLIHLCGYNKMSYDELNKIQDAQNETYNYIIKSTLDYYEKILKDQVIESLNVEDLIKLRIKKEENFIKENENIYYEVILPRKHKEKVLEAVTYQLSKNEKYITTNGQEAEIILLDKEYLKLRVDENKVIVARRIIK